MESRPLNLLNDLPYEVRIHVANKLDTSDLVAYAQASKSSHKLFQVDIAINKLLHHIARGEQDLAEKMIRATPSLLLEAGEVTDYSGRYFKNITAFQYALWALDSHMWKMILKYLPKDKAAQQLSIHLNKEKDYTALHGNHYNFDLLIQALRKGRKVSYESWVVMVGQPQKQVPAHIANEYCRGDVPFSKKRNFHESTLPRTLTFYNFNTHVDQNWFPLKENPLLGVDYAISQGRQYLGLGWTGGASQPGTVAGYEHRGEGDVDAMIKLAIARKKDLEELKSSLLYTKAIKSEDEQLNEIKQLITVLSKQINFSRFNFNIERRKIKLAFLQKVVSLKDEGMDLITSIMLAKEEFQLDERRSITAGVFSNRVGNLINSILR